jgi:hypothetical protein
MIRGTGKFRVDTDPRAACDARALHVIDLAAMAIRYPGMPVFPRPLARMDAWTVEALSVVQDEMAVIAATVRGENG